MREHEPRYARFLQPDPITPDVYDPTGLNPYAYALYNPVRYTDPSGYAPTEEAVEAGTDQELDSAVIGFLKKAKEWAGEDTFRLGVILGITGQLLPKPFDLMAAMGAVFTANLRNDPD